MAVFLCIGATYVAYLQVEVRVFWLFPTFMTSFFLTTASIAAVINTLSVLVLVTANTGFTSQQQMWAFITTSLVVSACSFIFARRTETQRRQLVQLAAFDPLTGVRNRRAMADELQQAAASGQRSGSAYALVMVDLDHFKRVNDKYGHSAGDRLLVQIAQLIARSIREVDHLFRFGGEEFVILLTGADGNGAKAVISNLREKMAQEIQSPDGPVTASYGVALLRKAETAENWLSRADAALYRAKDAGRDCVVIDDLMPRQTA